MDHQVVGTTLPVLEMTLQPGEKIVAQAGELSWMTRSIELHTTTDAGGSKGLFGNAAAVSFSDVRYSVDQTSGYYAKEGVSVEDVIKGTVTNPHAGPLKQALAARSAKVPPNPKDSASAK